MDSEGHMACLQKQEELYYDNEICQFANWFKYLLNSIGYEFINEVQYWEEDKINQIDRVTCNGIGAGS